MTGQPLVSVLMTAYNREKYIAEAIESVLVSTYRNFELIIVDDGSKDKTVDIALSYKAKDDRVKVYINEKNLGDYPNRNKAANYAIGKYIKYLDSDDIMYPHCLEVMMYCMEKFPDAGYGLSALSDENQPYPVCISPKKAYLEHFSLYGHFNRAPGSSIINRKTFIKVGGFTGERMIGDTQLWYTLSRKFDLVKMPRDLVWDRMHDGQERQSEYAKQYDKLNKKVFLEALNHADCPLSQEEKKAINREKYPSFIKIQFKKYFNV